MSFCLLLHINISAGIDGLQIFLEVQCRGNKGYDLREDNTIHKQQKHNLLSDDLN